MANTWVTADLHLDHAGIIRHTRRPWATVDEMNEALVERWNAAVMRGDTVIIAGDFAWKNHLKWLNRLNGSKVLVQGNHDKASQLVYQQFSKVIPRLETRINGHDVVFDHYPMKSWKNSVHGTWMLFGHEHGASPESPSALTFDIGVDIWDYRPIPWAVIEKKMKLKEEYRKEHPFQFDPEFPHRNREELRKTNLSLL